MFNQPLIWSPGVTLEAIEKQVIQKAFQFFRGNKSATANALGISVRTLDNKFEKYEADEAVEREREATRQQDREAFQRRQRGLDGPLPPAVLHEPTATPEGEASGAAETQEPVGVESSQVHTPVNPVSVSERTHFRDMLPRPSASRGRR